MEQDSPRFERLHQLVTSQLEGDPSDDERRELAELLRGSEAAQQFYVESIEDATSLRWWCSDIHPEGRPEATIGLAQPLRRRKASRVWVGLSALAASFFIAVSAGLLTLVNWRPDPVENQPAIAEKSGSSRTGDGIDAVATLTRLHGVRWAMDSTALSEMSRLPVGQVLWLEEGEAEIFFDQAVQLVVRGPASIEIRSPMEIFSPYGVISARVGESGKGFAIQTPRGRITDLGTEFGIAIGREGATEVAVFRGAVDLAYDMQDLNVNTRLVQGQALHLDSNGSLRRLVAINDNRFPSVHGGPRRQSTNGSSIFLDVRDNIRERLGAKFYRIVPGGLGEDVPAYVDRQHEWNGIDTSGMPEFLIGADYVMPFNEDKYTPTIEVTLTIGQPAALFVFLSDKAKVPAWLEKDFSNTGLKIGLDESGEFTNVNYRLDTGSGVEVDTCFSIWRHDISAPTSVTLGGVRPKPKSGLGFCMYGIAAIPLDAPLQP